MHAMKRSVSVALALGFLSTGCTQDGQEANSSSCEETRTALTRDEVSTLGFSVGSLVDTIAGERMIPFNWEDGSSTTLHIQVVYSDGIMNFVDAEPSETSGQEYTDAPAAICDDYVEVGVALSFKTDDGAFDETWQLNVTSLEGTIAGFNVDIDPETLHGTYDFTYVNPTDFDEVIAYMSGQISANSSTGTLYEQGSKTDGDTASATAVEAATWSAVVP